MPGELVEKDQESMQSVGGLLLWMALMFHWRGGGTVLPVIATPKPSETWYCRRKAISQSKCRSDTPATIPVKTSN